MDFEGLKDKVEQLAEEHPQQVDQGIDKAAGLIGEKFGHQDQVEAAAQKLKDAIPGDGSQQQ